MLKLNNKLSYLHQKHCASIVRTAQENTCADIIQRKCGLSFPYLVDSIYRYGYKNVSEYGNFPFNLPEIGTVYVESS